MKLSTYHKAKGDIVGFNVKNPDKVYLSTIFTISHSKLRRYMQYYGKKLVIGGSGYDLKTKLPYHIEHLMPDYELYNMNYSLGFSCRGCIRNCAFCNVREKEGYIREASPFEEFVHPDHTMIQLLDNNFLASPKWREKLEYLIDNKYKVCFYQGLDIRLLNEDVVDLLVKLRSFDSTFTKEEYGFSFDNIAEKKIVMEGINMVTNRRLIGNDRLRFLVLTLFDSTFKEDLDRIRLLVSLGVFPVIMRYNDRLTPQIKALMGWLASDFRVTSWNEYEGNEWKNEYEDIVYKSAL
jgi:hypothetical protein